MAGQTGNQPAQESKKGSPLAIFLFVLGILAMALIMLVTILRKLPSIFLGSEIVILLCLVGLLCVSIITQRRIVAQQKQRERYPYAKVDKRDIDKIFDIIADEEKKRIRLDAFAAGYDLTDSRFSGKQTVTEDEDKDEDEKSDRSEKPAQSTETDSPKDDAKTAAPSDIPEEEDSGIIHIFDDEEELGTSTEAAAASSEPEDKKTDTAQQEENDRKDEESKKKKPAAADNRQGKQKQGSRPPKKKRRPEGPVRYDQYGRPIKMRPYDPYYEDSYDDRGDRRRRRDPYDPYYDGDRRRRPPYDEPVYYDKYGNPIRRRPDPYGDPRRPEGQKRRRPPEGAPGQQKRRPPEQGAKRPAGAKDSADAALPQEKQFINGHEAPVAMAAKAPVSNYGDDYIPVAIVDDDYEPDYQERPRRTAPQKQKPHTGKKPASRPVVEEDEVDRSVPIVMPDDDYVSQYDDEPVVQHSSKAGAPSRKEPVSNEPYVPHYEDDESFVIVPTFEDAPDDYDSYSAPQGRGLGQGGYQEKQPVQNEQYYDDTPIEEDDVVVLPRDDGYESYVEEQRAKQRKAERRAQGKTALTIQKMRRKKVRRRSRKYKMFRASVHKLNDYLNSFSVKTGRR